MIEYFKSIKQDYFKIYMFIYVFFLPWDFFSGFGSNLTILLFIWWLFLGKKKGYFINLKDILRNKPLVFLFLFIIYAILSLLWSDNIKVGIKELEYYKYYPIIAIVFFSVFNKEDVKMAFYVIAFSFGVYAIFSLSIYMELFTVQLKDEISNKANPRGIWPYSIVVFYMALNVFLTIYFFINEKSLKLKYIFLFIATISFFTMLVNNGRMGQLSFIGTIFILMIYYRQYLFLYKKILVTFVVTLIISISFLYNTNKLDRYIQGFNELIYSYQNNEFKGSWGARLFFHKAAINIMSEKLIFGTGVGDALDEFREYQILNKEILHHRIVKQFHSQHLELLVKFGIFGYLLFLVSIFLLLKSLYQKNKYYMYIGIVFFSMFFMASLGDGIIRISDFDNFFIFMFVLLSIIVSKTNKEEEEFRIC